MTVPTGAGKTPIAEQAIARTVEGGGKAWYASPFKSADQFQIFRVFAPLWCGKRGILTGDRKENMDAPIIIGTTEILRNQLYGCHALGRRPGHGLCDPGEAHFLGDEERGVVWEETMIYLPRRIPLLLLSATIGNAHQIAGWEIDPEQ
ncbi:MAG: hypothetical protein R2874_13580 [Desulfobacterales bacterium]